ncbi:adenylyl-sulfate kinase [Nocardioides sp.]|uniref:adenylyl-sulfate kinase n=1 Tax=Nocardioides sp. TaxID=35761 RepID=UPI0031FEE390|nr:adenylylsulfate kinase [Nocardioides sp.]
MSTPPVPQHCPTPRELDDLELLTIGALAPLEGFNEPGSHVTLSLPAALEEQAAAAGAVELVDPEGLPLARVGVPDGAVTPLTHAQYGPFRRLYLSPAEGRKLYAGRTFVPVTDAITTSQLADLAAAGPVVLLALVGSGTPALSTVGLIRACLAAAAQLPDAAVVAVPLAARGDADVDHALGVQVVGTYAGQDPVLGLVSTSSTDDVEYTPEIAAIVDFERPAPDEQGLVLFFTGLSGSGKSTLARALMDRLLEQGVRTVTSLDGDVVRRNLSAGLTFSREDRETNIRRIGWVAAEISRHGGVAVCSPIAPFDETRQQVRRMVDEAGGAFFLVHVATPLEECERRDRKGLYAKARRGEIPEFTGISSPYEEPADADVRVDTTGRTIDAALDDVLVALRNEGYLDLTTSPSRVEEGRPLTDEGQPLVEEVALATVSKPGETAQGGPLHVLFVCTANICRSPFMEYFARTLVGPDAEVEFSSAGTHGFRERPMNPPMAATLAKRGGDASGFLSRPLSKDLIERADLVLTAEVSHRSFILDDHPGAFRKVFTLGQFAEAVSVIDESLSGRELLVKVGGQRGPAEARLDVRDPYGRGQSAAEKAAAQIEELLRVVVPALSGSRKITA